MGAKQSISKYMAEHSFLTKKTKKTSNCTPKDENLVSLDDFQLIKTVGRGSFAKVILVRKKDTNKVYAMKVLKKQAIIQRKQVEHTLSERNVVEKIHHPFIVNLKFAFQSKSRLYMVFEYFGGGEIFHYLSHGGFTEDRARLYAAEIVLALEYLHNRNIIFRDLKPENVLLDRDGHIRLTDFGLCKQGVIGDTLRSFVGTAEYLAPEIISRQSYGKAVDWWALGLMIYEMICGKTPFYDRQRKAMYKNILYHPLTFPSKISADARDLCYLLLQKNPSERLGYNGAKEIKSHRFFQSINWDLLFLKRIEPSFKPILCSETDTRNIDTVMTSIPVCSSPSSLDSGYLGLDQKEHIFRNFSFSSHSIESNRILCSSIA